MLLEQHEHQPLHMPPQSRPMIPLLATASDQQLKLAREMAGYFSPRPGFTQHPLTVHAAAHLNDLLKRAIHFTDAKKT